MNNEESEDRELVRCALSYGIARRGTSPLYGEGALLIDLVDEGGGAFVELRNAETPDERVRCSVEELGEMFFIAKKLMDGYDAATGSSGSDDDCGEVGSGVPHVPYYGEVWSARHAPQSRYSAEQAGEEMLRQIEKAKGKNESRF